jgi:hypothetical protein
MTRNIKKRWVAVVLSAIMLLTGALPLSAADAQWPEVTLEQTAEILEFLVEHRILRIVESAGFPLGELELQQVERGVRAALTTNPDPALQQISRILLHMSYGRLTSSTFPPSLYGWQSVLKFSK